MIDLAELVDSILSQSTIWIQSSWPSKYTGTKCVATVPDSTKLLETKKQVLYLMHFLSESCKNMSGDMILQCR